MTAEASIGRLIPVDNLRSFAYHYRLISNNLEKDNIANMRCLAFLMSILLVIMAVSSPCAQGDHAFSLPVDPDLYLIRPGDELRITFLKSQLEPVIYRVDPEGRLVDKTLGSYDLLFKTLTQAREILGEALANLYNVPEITIGITSSRPVSISVTGAVAQPGLYEVYTSQRVSDVIEMAGGITAEGSRRFITLSGGPKTLRVDLDRARYLGDYNFDPCVYAGRTISVPNRTDNLVHVAGEVMAPREIELAPDDDVHMLLRLASGVRRCGDSSQVQIIKRSSDSSTAAINAGDIILVPARCKSPEELMVCVFGAVEKHGLVTYREGMTLNDALLAVGGTSADANIWQTTVFRRPRLDSEGRTTTLRYPVSDPAVDVGDFRSLALQPQDSIFVPIASGFVSVRGAVRYPGIFPFVRGKEALHYIQMAGGFLPTSNKEQISVFNPVSKMTFVSTPKIIVRDGAVVRVEVREELK